MINAAGGVAERRSAIEQSRYQRMYRFAMNRGNLDSILDEFVVRPFTAALALVGSSGASLDQLAVG